MLQKIREKMQKKKELTLQKAYLPKSILRKANTKAKFNDYHSKSIAIMFTCFRWIIQMRTTRYWLRQFLYACIMHHPPFPFSKTHSGAIAHSSHPFLHYFLGLGQLFVLWANLWSLGQSLSFLLPSDISYSFLDLNLVKQVN